jgi:tetratricopeptide (TPR) repeat protein
MLFMVKFVLLKIGGVMRKATLLISLILFVSNICLAIESDVDIKALRKNLKSKDKAVVYQATADLAAYYRRNGELQKAERLLKNYQSPSGFDRMPPKEAIPFMRCLLETAHVRALNKDVPGSLKLLNWAEGRKRDYERAVGCLKYANILLDLNEPDRAEAYLRNVKKIVKLHYKEDTDTGAAIGQGSKVVDTNAAWRILQDQADYASATVEQLKLSKKFNPTYGMYVKLRRLQNIVKRSVARTGVLSRYYNEAMKLCDEIIKADPKSQFAAAAGYLKGKLLFTVIPDQESKQQKKQISEAKKYLEKFISDDKDGLYRGEAWMLLGKIALEKEWNAKASEKYYSEALKWFKSVREKRDALSLYASMDEKLKTQTLPTQKPTTLNKWKRTVYHEEDPLKLYNYANAPNWYISDKEKNCLFMLGFFKYIDKDYNDALHLWSQAGQLDPDIMGLQASNTPNILMRLKATCKLKRMAFAPDEHKLIKNKKQRLIVAIMELRYMLGDFNAMDRKCQELLDNPESCNMVKSAALIGQGIAGEFTSVGLKKESRMKVAAIFEQACEKGKDSPFEEDALFRLACYLDAGSSTKPQAIAKYNLFLKKFPGSSRVPAVMCRLVYNALYKKDLKQATVIYDKMRKKYPESSYTRKVSNYLNNKKRLQRLGIVTKNK